VALTTSISKLSSGAFATVLARDLFSAGLAGAVAGAAGPEGAVSVAFESYRAMPFFASTVSTALRCQASRSTTTSTTRNDSRGAVKETAASFFAADAPFA
jgi:hypothetical protein